MKCIIIIVLCVTIELFLGSFPKNFNIGTINCFVLIAVSSVSMDLGRAFMFVFNILNEYESLAYLIQYMSRASPFHIKIQKIHLSHFITMHIIKVYKWYWH